MATDTYDLQELADWMVRYAEERDIPLSTMLAMCQVILVHMAIKHPALASVFTGIVDRAINGEIAARAEAEKMAN